MKQFSSVALRPFLWAALIINRALYRVWLRYAAFETIDGLSFVDLASGYKERRAEILRDAIRLLEQVQPYRLTQVRRYLRRIIVSYTGGSGEYWSGMRVCIVDAEYILANGPVAVAMLLLHEATHGRLDVWRIRTTSTNVARVEHLCARAEIDFGSRVTGGELHVQRVLRSLEKRWWEPAQTSARQRRRLAQLKVPAWTLRLYDRVFRLGNGD